jgi:hypothetical protein
MRTIIHALSGIKPQSLSIQASKAYDSDCAATGTSNPVFVKVTILNYVLSNSGKDKILANVIIIIKLSVISAILLITESQYFHITLFQTLKYLSLAHSF